MAQAAKSNRAFTLIELLVAIVIILISVMGLMEMSIVVMRNNLRNEIRNKAVETLSNHVNNLTSNSYDNITAATTIDNDTKKIRNFDEQFTIFDNVTMDSTGSKNIQSTISWTYRGKTYSYTINTVVNKNE